MVAKLMQGFWPTVARIILRNRILILILVTALTVFLALQWRNIKLSNTEANILPDDHIATIQYNIFTGLFGEEGNAVVFAVRDPKLFDPNNFNRWNKLSKQLEAFPEIDFVGSTDNLQVLVKDEKNQEFLIQDFIKNAPDTPEKVAQLKEFLLKELPFYDGLIYNPKSETIQTIAYLDKDIMNTSVRNEFILNDLGDLIKNFEEETGLDMHVSGMPYIRTWNTKSIVDEIGIFIAAALLVTSLIFFFLLIGSNFFLFSFFFFFKQKTAYEIGQ